MSYNLIKLTLTTTRARKLVLAALALACALASASYAEAAKFTSLHVFEGTPDGSFPSGPLVQDADGNLYGTTTSGGGDNGTVYKVDKTGHESILFSFHGSDGGFPSSGLILDAA